MHKNIIVIISSNLNKMKYDFNTNLAITNMTNDFEFIYLSNYASNIYLINVISFFVKEFNKLKY